MSQAATYLETEDQSGNDFLHLDPGQVPANADPFAMQKREARLLHHLPVVMVCFHPSLRAEDIRVGAVDGNVTGGIVRGHGDVRSGRDLDVANNGIVARCPFGYDT